VGTLERLEEEMRQRHAREIADLRRHAFNDTMKWSELKAFVEQQIADGHLPEDPNVLVCTERGGSEHLPSGARVIGDRAGGDPDSFVLIWDS